METRSIPGAPSEARVTNSRRKGSQNSKCAVCNRVFTRKEHLVRHSRTHTEDVPFKCKVCSKRFQRQDVLQRHFKNLCDDGIARQRSRSARRTAKACNGCRLHKLKCDGAMPCQRCRLKSASCLYTGSDDGARCFDSSSAVFSSRLAGDIIVSPASEQMPPPVVRHANNTCTPSPVLPVETFSTAPVAQVNSAEFAEALASTPEMLAMTETSSGLISSYDQSASNFDLESLELWPSMDKVCSSWSDMLLYSRLPVQPFYGPFFLNVDFGLFFEATDANDGLVRQASSLQQWFCSPGPSDTPINTPRMPEWLLNLRPNIQPHDKDIIGFFLHKFICHVAPMMPIFQDAEHEPSQPPELLLAMAAVGGLFCPIEGSFRISLAMHTDARRLALSRALSSDQLSMPEAIDLAQTLMCLEIFGLCSGDSRAFECTEAQHGFLLQSVEDYSLTTLESSLTDFDVKRRLRLVESLCVLESYHVLILRRPAHLSTTIIQCTFAGFDGLQGPSESTDLLEDCFKLFASIMNPQTTLHCPTTPTPAMCCLTLLAAVSGNSSSEGVSMLNVFWKQDLLELGLHRWWNACQTQIPIESHLSTTSLFHLIFINIRTNVELLHKSARWQICGSASQGTRLADVEIWQSSEDCDIAAHHARQLLDAAKQSVVFDIPSGRRTDKSCLSTMPTQDHGSQKAVAEVPHLAIGVYVATLVLWAKALARQDPDCSLAGSALEDGVLVLSRFQVRVAIKLCCALGCLRKMVLS
ncbi:hypothetical protein V8C43DRAFT_292789 [Trichoderma afarasin]